MSKVADVKLFWTKSPSIDVKSQRLEVSIDGVQQSGVELGPEVQDVTIVVKASQTVVFSVVTTDKDGLEVASTSYTINLGDLEAPFPAMDLGHIVMAIRDVPDEPPVPDDL